MGLTEILFIAVGLSMDSLAVSITCGAILKCFHIRHIFRIALFMGVFQGIMPLLGWLAGISFQKYIESFDHWVAFGILSYLGGKMLYDGLKPKDDDCTCMDPTKISTLISLAIATSIDALVVGVSFALLKIEVIEPVLIIGLTTFILSFIGAAFSSKFGHKINLKIEIIGGIILIAIGIHILIQHLFFLP